MKARLLLTNMSKNTRGVSLLILLIFVVLFVGFATFKIWTKQNILINRLPADEPTTITYTTEQAKEIYKDEILRFAVVADIHIGQSIHGREGGNSRRLQRAIEVSKEYKAEFFVALGDITQTGSKKEFEEAKRILDEGKMPYYTAIGNHDVIQNQDYYDKVFGPKFRNVSYALQKKPTQLYAPVNPEAKLLFLSMSNLDSELGGTLGTNQILWLKNMMPENINSTNTIVLAFSGEGLQSLNNSDQDALTLFLCESHVAAYIHGGPHVFFTQQASCYFDWMYNRDTRLSKINTISPGTIGEYSPERSAQVLVVHVFPDFRYEIERVPIGFNPIYPEYSQ